MADNDVMSKPVDDAAEDDLRQLGLAKKLAHTDKAIRDAALAGVRQWLQKRVVIDATDMMKLWKALYYCMWMSDKPLVQHELAECLAGLVDPLPADRAVLFFASFLKTMLREWHGTDKLRLDKFYTLVRKALRHMFQVVWMLPALDGDRDDEDPRIALADQVADTLQRTVLNVDDTNALGLALHVSDIVVDELSASMELVSPDDEGAFPIVLNLLNPFVSILADRCAPAIAKRIVHKVFFRMIDDAEAITGANDDEPLDVSTLTTMILLNADTLSTMMFELGSDPDTSEGSRKTLYDLRTRFAALHEQVQAAMQQSDDDDSDDDDSDDASVVDGVEGDCCDDDDGDCCGDDRDCCDQDGTSDGDLPADVMNAICSAEVDESDEEPTAPPAPVAIETAPEPTSKRRRRRRSSLTAPEVDLPVADMVQFDVDVANEPPMTPKKQRLSAPLPSTGGGSPSIPDVVADTPRSKSVSFSTTKSVRKFNEKIPIKIKETAQELTAKKSAPVSVLKATKSPIRIATDLTTKRRTRRAK